MVHEFSFGIIPLRHDSSGWQVLLIQHYAGHWSFPKGHANPGETSLAAATRELKEETGLQIVKLLSEETLPESYHFTRQGKHVEKKVLYYLAEVKGTITLQKEEVQSFKWVPLANASKNLTYPAAKNICKRALHLLSNS